MLQPVDHANYYHIVKHPTLPVQHIEAHAAAQPGPAYSQKVMRHHLGQNHWDHFLSDVHVEHEGCEFRKCVDNRGDNREN